MPFPYAEYEEMASRLRPIKGRAIVSLNDHPDIRRAFDGFHIETVGIKYTVGVATGRPRGKKSLSSVGMMRRRRRGCSSLPQRREPGSAGSFAFATPISAPLRRNVGPKQRLPAR